MPDAAAIFHGDASVTYGAKPLSFLSVPGAKEVGIEVHSLSKAFNMTGWRLAFVAGNPLVVKGFANVKDALHKKLSGLGTLFSVAQAAGEFDQGVAGRSDNVGGWHILILTPNAPRVDIPQRVFWIFCVLGYGVTTVIMPVMPASPCPAISHTIW